MFAESNERFLSFFKSTADQFPKSIIDLYILDVVHQDIEDSLTDEP